MTHNTMDRAGEQRWLVLGEDGRHVWLGRCTDPTPEKIAKAQAALVAQGLAGWLAVMEGDYWRRRTRLVLLEVQPLGAPALAFTDAARAFEARRATALAPAGRAA
jgi:hypothetical protein